MGSQNGATSSLATRVAAALGLMVSFYAFAMGIGLGLMYLAYLDATTGERMHPKVIIFCVAAGASVLWAIIPRPDKFEAPGPRIHSTEEPELFNALQEVAAATSQAMPAEVYVVNDVNAFVTSRGGIMGFGSRRVMGLGLPLMQALTVQEFKGVLAHEFGHYSAGDVGLGPWIHKTRSAIGRTIQQLNESVLQILFIWYGNLFLRITHAISRRQEFVADEVAARVVGGDVMSSALRKVRGAAFAFDGYWGNDLGLVIGAGHLPPVSQGFARFMSAPHVQTQLRAIVSRAEIEDKTDIYDTHPALGERLAALATQPRGTSGDPRSAATLLTNIAKWERRVLASIVSDEWARGLKALEWDKVAETVYVPLWRERVKDFGQLLQGRTIATAPHTQEDLVRLGSALRGADEGEIAPEVAVHRAWQLLIASIALPLVEMGWSPLLTPGDEVTLRRDGHEFKPYSELSAVVKHEVVPDWWRSRCEALGIAAVTLTDPAAVA
jgi:Zn-dependent protease with chaperone function